jgi:two-component system, OmpR family, alkaline phosphatase synthesis response regulator PhoP
VVDEEKQKLKRLRRIVIIDDEPAFSTVLSNIVSGLGYEVVISSDPKSSRTYELRDSDIVFIDVLMPHVSGIQVLEQLARQNVKSAIAIMSGQGERLDEAEKLAKKLGLYHIGTLEKPFRLADVKLVLEGA